MQNVSERFIWKREMVRGTRCEMVIQLNVLFDCSTLNWSLCIVIAGGGGDVDISARVWWPAGRAKLARQSGSALWLPAHASVRDDGEKGKETLHGAALLKALRPI